MKFPKKNRSNKYLIAQAEFSYNSGAVIDWGSNCDDWVSIDIEGFDEVFMQGESAAEFMQEMNNLCRRFRSIDEYTAALIVAAPYIENCF